MASEIIVAALSLLGTLGGSLSGILVSNRLTNYRLEQLERRVQTHNSLIERTYTQRGSNTCRLWAALSGAFCRSLIGGRQPTRFANAKNPSKMPRPQVLRSQGRIHFRPDKKKAAGNIGHIAKAFSAVWAEMNLP